jgi:hypothetical protein
MHLRLIFIYERFNIENNFSKIGYRLQSKKFLENYIKIKIKIYNNNNDYLIILHLFLSTFCFFCFLYVEPIAAHMHCWLSAIALFVPFLYKALSAKKEIQREREGFSSFNHTD